MDYEKLKEVIAKVIKENGQGEITGPALQMVLMTMVDSLGEVYPQTYTSKQKAQARANIDALANYDGEITKEKLAQSIQDTLNKVRMNVKALPDGTDLLSEDLEEGIYVVDNITMMMDNVPKDLSLNCLALLIVTTGGERTIFGLDTNQYPFVSYKNSDGEWAYVKLGTVGTKNIADGAVTEDKLASQSVSSKKIKDQTIGASKLGAKSVTEPKLDDVLTAKVNNNVKTVEQTLTYDEVRIASKNLKFRDGNGNFFADKTSYDDVGGKPYTTIRNSIFGNNCVSNSFNGDCLYNILGNNCRSNTLGNDCRYNTLGNNCNYNILGNSCWSNTLGNGCWANSLGTFLNFSKLDNGVSYIELKSNANSINRLSHIHILSGVSGKSQSEKLVINIPDEYLNSPRELIITTKRTDNGPSTPEDIVMYYADEVVDKQNKQDNTLETTSKEVVGAINELFNGDVKNNSITTEKLKDQAVEYAKLSASIRSTLDMVGTNVKILPKGTDLLSDDIEEGIYTLFSGSGNYDNYPYSKGLNPGRAAILAKVGDDYFIIGADGGSSDEFPILLMRRRGGTYWYGNSIAQKFFNKLDTYAGAVKTNNLADGAVTAQKIAKDAVLSVNIADMAVKEAKLGLELADKINGAAQKAVVSKALEVIELTDNNTQNKVAIDARIAKLTELGVNLTNGYAIPISYISGNKEYHGMVTAGKNSLLNGIVSDAQGQSYFAISVGATDGIVTFDENDPLVFKNEMQSSIDTLVTCVEFTKTTLSNKAHLDAYLAKLPNAKVMCCTYNGTYAGTLHKIGEDWFGLLVKNTNNYEDALQVKLQADGTLIEGTTSLAQVNAKLDTIIG